VSQERPFHEQTIEFTVTLTAAGFFNMSHECRAGAPVENKMFE
jgi:hypothetical protein